MSLTTVIVFIIIIIVLVVVVLMFTRTTNPIFNAFQQQGKQAIDALPKP